MTDYTKMDGPELQEVCGDRAELWAEAFCQRHGTIMLGDPSLMPSMMAWWFDMAIEQSHTVRMRRHLAEPSPTWREEAGRAGPIACSLSAEEVSTIRRRMIAEGQRGPVTEEDARACIAARPKWREEAEEPIDRHRSELDEAYQALDVWVGLARKKDARIAELERKLREEGESNFPYPQFAPDRAHDHIDDREALTIVNNTDHPVKIFARDTKFGAFLQSGHWFRAAASKLFPG